MSGQFHHIDGHFDVHIALGFAPSLQVHKLFGRFGHDGEPVIIEPVHQWPDGRVVRLFEKRSVVECANQNTLLSENSK